MNLFIRKNMLLTDQIGTFWAQGVRGEDLSIIV